MITYGYLRNYFNGMYGHPVITVWLGPAFTRPKAVVDE